MNEDGPRIFYPVPERIPDPRARFLQIVNTCHAMALEGAKVELAAGLRKGTSGAEVLRAYGLPDAPGFTVRGVPILRADGKEILRVSWHGLFHVACRFRLARLLREGRYCVYVRHIKLADFLLRHRARLGFRLFFEVHELFHRGTERQRNVSRLRQMESRVYGEADGVVCMSRRLEGLLREEGVTHDRVAVIPHAVKEEWFDIRRGEGAGFVGYVGSLYPWKGVDVLVSAMRYLPGEKALIVGGGDRLPALKELAAREGAGDRVEFTGPVLHAEVPGMLARMKVAVLPNVAEEASMMSSPLKMFEYLAAGVPIVAADLPVFREILVHGKNALLFPPGDATALAAAVRRLAEDPGLSRRLGERARRDAEGFTYARRARRILDFIVREGVSR